MARLLDRHKALELRKKGMSYSQIKAKLGLSKSTLSLWLRDYPLSEERIKQLRDWSEIRIEKFRETMRMKKEHRLQKFYIEEKEKLLPLSLKELFLAGLFLYLGEGAKGISRPLQISNTDPDVIKFGICWYTNILKIPKEKISIVLHLYNDMDIKNEREFWLKQLKLPESNFKNPYIKNTNRSHINHSGFGHGTCNICVSDVRLKERILMALKAITDNYNVKI